MRDPTFLYRYRSLNGEALQRVLATLRSSELYFASPGALNDPFDCKVHFSFNAPDSVFEKYFRRSLRRSRPNLSPLEQANQARQWIKEKRHRAQKFRQGFENDIQKAVNGLGVLCFSAKPDDLRMWSYYASGHTGLCLQFSLSRHETFLGRAAPVRYRRRYPNVNVVLISYRAQVDALLFTKASAWKHEAEWRIVDPDSGVGVQYFPSGLLAGIIFGCRIEPTVRDEIIAVSKARNSPPRLFQARLGNGKFAVEVQAL